MTLRHDISQFYVLKATIEDLLGNQAWLDLKECTSLARWRIYVLKLYKAIRLSIEESIEVYDSAWIESIHANLDDGIVSAKSSESIEELLSCFSATLLRQVFLQIGMLPNRSTARKVTLSRENWRLNSHRSVHYFQTRTQIESAFWTLQQKNIGFNKQMELRAKYKSSKSGLPFSQWCNELKSD